MLKLVHSESYLHLRQKQLKVENASTTAEARHPIQAVSLRTGLSADVLRAWERRYEAVRPARSAAGRRLYSDADIARLALLRRATRSGRSIAQLAGLSDDRLESLVATHGAAAGSGLRETGEFVRQALSAARRNSPGELEDVLRASAAVLGPRAAVDRIVQPFLEAIAQSWSDAELGIAVGHLASALSQSVRDNAAG